MVDQDQPIRRYDDPQVRSRRIFRKNLYNGATMLSYLFANWLFFFVFLLTIDTATGFYHAHGAVIIPLTLAFLTLFAIGYFILVEWVGLGFRRMQPRFVSIYDPYYWFHERYWKFSDSFLRHAFKGTPFRNLVIRLAGARVGRKVFDDGCYYVEKTLTKVGDYCCLNEWSVLQGHSMEEGIFKSDRIEIGKGCSIAPVAFVHYGVRMGDNVVLGPDSFLMKGEVLASDTCWHGNPARQASGGPR